MENFTFSKPKSLWKSPVVIALVIILAVCLYLVYKNLANRKTQNSGQTLSQNSKPSEIQSGMTFNTINSAFKMPPDILKRVLNITDSRYPQLTIDELAKIQNLDPQQVLAKTRDAVNGFLKPAIKAP